MLINSPQPKLWKLPWSLGRQPRNRTHYPEETQRAEWMNEWNALQHVLAYTCPCISKNTEYAFHLKFSQILNEFLKILYRKNTSSYREDEIIHINTWKMHDRKRDTVSMHTYLNTCVQKCTKRERGLHKLHFNSLTVSSQLLAAHLAHLGNNFPRAGINRLDPAAVAGPLAVVHTKILIL